MLDLAPLSLSAPRRARIAASAPRTRPIRTAIFGDSFGQRSQDVSGSPGEDGATAVSTGLFNFPGPQTNAVGGVAWGVGAWMAALSGGRYVMPYQLNFAVGGSTTEQLKQDGGQTSGTGTDRLSLFCARMQAEQAAGRPVDLCVLHAGTNDATSGLTVEQSFSNLVTICEKIAALGISVILFTASPRGDTANTGARLTSAQIAFAKGLRDRVLTQIEQVPTLLGKVKVANGWLQEVAEGNGDAVVGKTYDGVHPSPDFARELALSGLAAADALLRPAFAPQLASGPDPADLLGSRGQMAGSGGTLQALGSVSANAGFTISGSAPDGWTLIPGVPSGGAWSASGTTNVKGTVTGVVEPSGAERVFTVTVACNSTARSNENTVQLEARTAVPLAGLSAGDWIEALVRIELAQSSGFRGADLALRFTEPDGVLRTVRCLQPPPNGTPYREWNDTAALSGGSALVLRTAPRQIKPGTYGAIDLAVILAFHGQNANLSTVARILRPRVRKVVWSA